MLDLQVVGRQLFAKAEPVPAAGAAEVSAAPEIVATIVSADTDLDKVTALLKESGLDTAVLVKSEGEGFVTFAKADADTAEDTVVIKTGESLALIVRRVRKAFDAYTGSTSFTDAVKAQTFYMSYYTAKDVLSDSIASAIQAAGTPADAVAAVGAIIDEFKAYVTVLMSALPATAFFVDRGMYDLGHGSYAPVMGCTDDDGGADDAAVDLDITIVNKAAAKPGPNDSAVAAAPAISPPAGNSISGAGAQDGQDAEDAQNGKGKKKQAAGGAATKDEAAEEGAGEAVGEPTDVSTLLAGLQKAQADSLQAALEGIQKSVTDAVSGLADEVREQVAGLSGRIDQVDQQVQKADAAISGTVFAETGGDPLKPVKKADGAGIPPLMDTAFDRRR